MSFFRRIKECFTGKRECYICKRYRRCPDQIKLTYNVDDKPHVIRICESCGFVLEDLKASANRSRESDVHIDG